MKIRRCFIAESDKSTKYELFQRPLAIAAKQKYNLKGIYWQFSKQIILHT